MENKKKGGKETERMRKREKIMGRTLKRGKREKCRRGVEREKARK